MNIKWNEVTRFSQVVALVLFIGIFGFGIWLGMQIEKVNLETPSALGGK